MSYLCQTKMGFVYSFGLFTLGPLEPLTTVFVEYLSYKTTCLLALVAASRVSELHALSRQERYITWHKDGSVLIRTQTGF